MKLNVVKNAKRNLIFGVINKGIALILPFAVRTAINYKLGSEYLGLNSLFSSILAVLNLSELGFGIAIVYHMYEPVAKNDIDLVCALLNLYRKIYAVVGIVILTLGLAMTPVVPYLVNGSYPKDINLTWVYLIFLFDTVISYFMYSYLSSLLTVYQRNDWNSIINTVISILLNGAKVVIILLFENYYYLILIQPLFTVLSNIWTAFVVRKAFPQYNKCYGNVEKKMLLSIRKLVAGAFIQKVCAVTRNSLDSICISLFLGLTLTGIYNNYYMISTSISSFLGLFYCAFVGGIGNHIVAKSKLDNFTEMKKLDFVYLWLSGWCTVSLLCLFQPFMQLWMGENMLLDIKAVILLCVYFYLLKLGDIRYMYTEAKGLWWEHKYRAIIETIGNVILNIVLGRFFGIYGILIATIITILLINYLWGARITFRSYFGIEKIKEYFSYQLAYTVVNLVVCIVTFSLMSLINAKDVLITLILRACLCIVIPNIMYIIFYHKKSEFNYIVSLIRRK